ncbi:Protein methyltransferase hemK [Corynebacterium renale]|uniref:peptide chain release factor N(5)-glutamine methyltransferase n=1 Tax=Corynebacterium renale TaxID=1724 RepID=UPI000DA31BA1|nr:peptide chain release factor N(5)-glutamine methyltransferase [Corynebacterium renale]SQG64489.1 Protein methyltransferase hemK [Corynebacterium renale]
MKNSYTERGTADAAAPRFDVSSVESAPTVRTIVAAAAAALSGAGVESPEYDATELAAHLLGCSHMEVKLRGRDVMAEGYAGLVERRARRIPLQHIVGTAPFGPLDLFVGPGVFVPRFETEVLADWAVQWARRKAGDQQGSGLCIVDLCTGSGALAAYLASHLPAAQVVAVELSDDALKYAAKNLRYPNVELIAGDATDPNLLGELAGRVDLVVTNPPYVPESDDLSPEVYHDPHMAVFSGDSGMDMITQLAPVLFTLVRPGGVVAVEHDDTTSEETLETLRSACFADVRPLADLTGRKRFALGVKPASIT